MIVGLLIGGILAAQSMIGTSKIISQAAQIQQFDAGVESFKAKYNALPGDAKAFGGDGDGTITAIGWGPGVHIFAYEIANFWYCLNQQEFSGPQIQANPPITTGTTKNSPESKMGKKGSFVISAGLAVSQDAYPNLSNPQNYYAILGPTQTVFNGGAGAYVFVTTSSTNAATTPVDLLALDKKIDDGIANTGYVASGAIGNNSGFGLGGIIAIPTASLCSTSGTYYLTSAHNRNECTPIIRIGAMAGDLQ